MTFMNPLCQQKKNAFPQQKIEKVRNLETSENLCVSWNIINQHEKTIIIQAKLGFLEVKSFAKKIGIFRMPKSPKTLETGWTKIAEVFEHLRAFGSGLHLKRKEGTLLLGL